MLSVSHLIIIFLVALIVFGPEKLPELARNLSKVMREVNKATGGLRESLEQDLRQLEREVMEQRTIAAPAPASTVLASATPETVSASFEDPNPPADDASSTAESASAEPFEEVPAVSTAIEEPVSPESSSESPADGHPTAA